MRVIGALLTGLVVGIAALSAQAQPPEEFPVLPAETFSCNFVGDSDMADLQRSFDRFNSWADQNGIDNLTMFVLTPDFVSSDNEYDIFGLNIWPDGAAFGSGNDKIAASTVAYESFTGVVDCDSHSLSALIGVKPPSQDVQTGGLFEFSNCTLKGNRSGEEGIAAVAAAAGLLGQWNLNDAHGVMFNIAGAPLDTSYQFKWISYYPSYSTLGTLYDHMVNDGGVQAMAAIQDPVMDCDSSRIYQTTVMRASADE